MDWQSPLFVLGLVLICTWGWVATTHIRAKHGYPVTDDWGRNVKRETTRDAELLAAENEKLKGMIVRLEDRLATLERIATDQPSRLSAEIDRLR